MNYPTLCCPTQSHLFSGSFGFQSTCSPIHPTTMHLCKTYARGILSLTFSTLLAPYELAAATETRESLDKRNLQLRQNPGGDAFIPDPNVHNVNSCSEIRQDLIQCGVTDASGTVQCWSPTVGDHCCQGKCTTSFVSLPALSY